MKYSAPELNFVFFETDKVIVASANMTTTQASIAVTENTDSIPGFED